VSRAELSIIVFAYNEAENVAHVLGELCDWLRAHEPRSEVVFVDDGSTDGTLEAARRALSGFPATLLRHEHNRGIGAALKSGVRACQAPWVTFMPADGQIEPAAIRTLRAASADGTELVLSTYEDRADGLHRTLLSAGLRVLIRAVHGVQLDSEGPYLFRRALFDADALPPDSFFLNFEFPIRTLARGVASRNVVIRCRRRRAGVSKSTGMRRVAGVARELIDLRVRRWRE
jgi:dolichol-phosphate mannosyltransferase